MKRIIALFLVALLLTGCRKTIGGEDLMKNVKSSDEKENKEWITIGSDVPDTFDPETDEPWDNKLIGDFGLRLLRASMNEGENALVAPYSVLSALTMTAGGADGNTLTRMETVLGQSVDALNNWAKFGTLEDDPCLRAANGIWFKDAASLIVEERFLQRNADYYQAAVYKAAFDNTTLKDINGFVEKNTDGMIKDILQEIPEDVVMYLVNALAFEAEWQEVYKADQVHDATFTAEDGTQQAMKLMWSEERLYLENDLATGFIKNYKEQGYPAARYAFAAFLPKAGVTVAELVDNLDGDSLQSFLANPQVTTVNAAMPKFEAEFAADLSQVLVDMGMSDAFDSSLADFSRMGSSANGNLYISQVLHKTSISVAEKGTKAGAATAVAMAEECAIEEIKQVVLNRPFLYMIIDTQTNTPVFIGTLMEVSGTDAGKGE